MTKCTWRGVYPAATTQFAVDQSVDLKATGRHFKAMVDAGVHGLIALGTVGENTSLDADEKRDVLKVAVEAGRGRIPVLTGVAENSTRLACRFAEDAKAVGVDGLMVLPAMVYRSDSRETLGHFREVAQATDLPIMVYNNPIAYTVDISPEMFVDLSDEKTIVAIKESSEDTRRLTDIVNACGNRYVLFCGVDDLVLEAVMLGAVGWVAGLVNAFPVETMRLWTLVSEGRWTEAREFYKWFAPLLHLDTHTKLVQYIKIAESLTGLGSEVVRAPRMALEGAERERISAIVRNAFNSRERVAV